MVGSTPEDAPYLGLFVVAQTEGAMEVGEFGRGEGADVVGEVGEEAIGEGIVAEVLDGAPSVGVGVSLLELGFGESGVMF